MTYGITILPAAIAGIALYGVDDPVLHLFHDANMVGYAVLRPGGTLVVPVKMYLSYLEQTNQLQLNNLILTGKFFSILAGINEECRSRYLHIVRQMMEAKGVTEDMKRQSQMEWVRAINSIASRMEEIVMAELIYA